MNEDDDTLPDPDESADPEYWLSLREERLKNPWIENYGCFWCRFCEVELSTFQEPHADWCPVPRQGKR